MTSVLTTSIYSKTERKMWIFASILLLGAGLLSDAREFEVNKTRSRRLSYQDAVGVLDDFFQEEGSGERRYGITEIFAVIGSQSPSDDVVENPRSLVTAPQGENGQEITGASEPEKVASKIAGPSPKEQPDIQIKTRASKSGITDISEVEFRDSPDSKIKTQASKSGITDISEFEFRDSPDSRSRSIKDWPENRRKPRYGALVSSNRQIHSTQPFTIINGKLSTGHRKSLSKIQEEMKTSPDDVNSDTEGSEDYDYDMDHDNDIDSIYTLAHFRHELYAYVDELVVAANRSVVELQLQLQQKISQLENQLAENLAYTSLLETKIHVLATPLPGDIRLLSGDSGGKLSQAGYLLYYTGTTWGFVCDDFFDAAAVKVACTQLGYTEPRSTLESGLGMSASEPDRQIKRRWEDSYRIVLDDVRCTGEESAIDSCSHWEHGHHDCSLDEAVYLSC